MLLHILEYWHSAESTQIGQELQDASSIFNYRHVTIECGLVIQPYHTFSNYITFKGIAE
jgi:hypothetical protein